MTELTQDTESGAHPGSSKRMAQVLIAASKRPETMANSPEEIFRLYAQFSGDIESTALAANKDVAEIAEMVEAGEWSRKIAVLIKLQKSGIPGDAQRGVNRAVNFVQADRLRCIIERVLRGLSMMSNEELLSYSVATVWKGRGEDRTSHEVLSTRPFADLAAALEKCHAMTYQALSDTATDRKDRREDADAPSASAGELHLAIADAMAQVRAESNPKQLT